MTLNGSEKTLDKQAKVCVMVNGNANSIADARGWKGAIRAAFINKVNALHNARLHAVHAANPSL